MKPTVAIAIAGLLFGVAASPAGADCCQQCGCSANCCQVCRCVPDVKKVPKTTYTCKCEDFCVPGPSEHCVVRDECGNKQHVFTPTCAKIYTRKTAVRHETVEEVKTYKWVVVNLCPNCCTQSEQTPPQSAATAQAGLPSTGQQVAYQAPAGEGSEAPTTTESALKSQLRRILQPVLRRESSAP